MADPISRSYRARYTLYNTDALLPLGATVNVLLPKPMTQDLVNIPIAALFDDRDGRAVWVIQNDKGQTSVSRRAVKVASLTSRSANIAQGLQVGETIVSMGAHRLKDGQVVRVLETTSAHQSPVKQ